MTIDLLDQERLRSGNHQPTLAQLLEKSELRVLPLSAYRRADEAGKKLAIGAAYEPSLVWHPEAPELALAVLGGSKSVSRFEYAFEEIPDRRFTAACGCTQCLWSFDPTISDEDPSQGSKSSAALFEAVARVAADADQAESLVPKFRGIAVRKCEYAMLCGIDRVLGDVLTDPECLPSFVGHLKVDVRPLARAVKLFSSHDSEVAFA